MRLMATGFFIGVLAASFVAALPVLTLPEILLAVAVLIAGFIVLRSRRWLWPLWSAGLGVLWLVLYVQLWGPQDLPGSIDGIAFEVSGQIHSIPECNQRRCRFDFDMEDIHSLPQQWPQRVRISWYHPKVRLRAGQQWRLWLKLKPPHGFSNPGGFDYESWLFQRGVAATGYVRQPQRAQLLGQPVTLNSLRQRLGERLAAGMAGSPMTGMLRALTTGDRQQITAAQWQVLTRTGTIHLLAISGLHIGLLYGLFFWLGRRSWSFSSRLCLLRPAQDIGVVAGLLAALAYAALAGFTIPTQRAMVMLLVIAVAMLARRVTAAMDVLLLALLAVLLMDPLSLLSPGFWLSFVAVAVIFAVLSRSRDAARGTDQSQQTGASLWLRHLVLIQFAIMLGLLPLLALFFHQISLIAPLANLLAVPWLSFIVIPLTLLGAALLPLWSAAADFLLSAAGYLLNLLWPLLQAASQLPAAVRHIAQPAPWVLLLALLGISLVFVLRQYFGHWRSGWIYAGLILLLPLIFIPARTPVPGSFQVDVLDVGQGLAVVVRTAQHSLLFDAGYGDVSGAGGGTKFNIGERVILPYFWHQGVEQLQRVIISHDDADHAGGLLPLWKEMSVASLLLRPGSRYAAQYPDSRRCQSGQRWRWDGVDFEILHPGVENWRKENNKSCVLRVSNAGGSVLLTGDIEQKAEQLLVERYAGRLQSDLLLAPHHGSRTSSSPAFLAAVKPQQAVFSVGYKNRFNLPSREVVARYTQAGIDQYRSDTDGMVRVIFSATGTAPQIQRWRQQRQRFWQQPVEK